MAGEPLARLIKLMMPPVLQLPLAAANDGGPFSFFHTAKGPEFLFGYAIWFGVLFLGSLAIRKDGARHPAASIAACFLYEIVGVIRIVDGSAHGMHKWNFLIIMMVFGAVFFFVRFDKTGGSSDSSSSWWSSCI